MHACGHDLHTCVGLGVAMALARDPRQLPGRVRLLFQPAEETAEGARWLVEAGAVMASAASMGCTCFPAFLLAALACAMALNSCGS